jgi:urea transport system ATP-binding protein
LEGKYHGGPNRALLGKPRLLLLLDEPTKGIQPSVVLDIQRAVSRIIREAGISMLLVQHHASFVRQSACYYAMQKGGIVASGAHGRSQLGDDPALLERLRLEIG